MSFNISHAIFFTKEMLSLSSIKIKCPLTIKKKMSSDQTFSLTKMKGVKRKFRVGTLNVNTLRGRVCEVVETLSRRKVDVCCIQETRYSGGSCRTIKDKDTRYKLYWSGNDKGTAGVGVFVAEEWIEKVSLRQNYFSETHSRPACGYLSVCICPTEWSKWWG